MTRLIKSADLSDVRRVQPAPLARPVPAESDTERQWRSAQAEIDTLRQGVQTRDEHIRRLQLEHTKAVTDAKEQGRAAGRKEGDDLRSRSLEHLSTSLERALSGLDAAYAGLEPLAPLVARAALARLIGPGRLPIRPYRSLNPLSAGNPQSRNGAGCAGFPP